MQVSYVTLCHAAPCRTLLPCPASTRPHCSFGEPCGQQGTPPAALRRGLLTASPPPSRPRHSPLPGLCRLFSEMPFPSCMLLWRIHTPGVTQTQSASQAAQRPLSLQSPQEPALSESQVASSGESEVRRRLHDTVIKAWTPAPTLQVQIPALPLAR